MVVWRHGARYIARWICMTALGACAPAMADESIRIVTEELPPYNMTEGGRVTGMSSEVVEAVLKEVGLHARIEVMPWARAYDLALNVENVLIYSIARTPAREAKFNWVGAIAPTNWFIYCLSERPVKLDSLDDARGHQIATVNEDVGEQYLLAHGFELGKELQSSNKYEHNYRKLKIDHVELWISNELNAVYLTRQNGDDPATTLIPALPLPDLTSDEGLSMAFSLKTPAATVQRFREGLERIRRNGTYDAIVSRWLAKPAVTAP